MAKSIIDKDIADITKRLGKTIPQLSGKTLLISGGAGFIGSYILRTIAHLNKTKLKRGCRVISVDNYFTGTRRKNNSEFPQSQFIFLEHDMRQPLDIAEKIDFIIHAAGVASPIYYQKYPLETIEVTIWGVKHLLELARLKHVKSFLYFSSSEVYGDPDSKFIPTPETYLGNVSSTGNRACYDESKRLGETLCMVYHRLYKIPAKIVRPFNIYGPGMKAQDYRVIPTFLTNGLKGKYLPVHEKGNQTRTFCYISDAIVGFMKILLLGKNGEVYNVGNDQNEINMMSLAQIVSSLFAKSPEIRMLPYPAVYPSNEPQRRCPDLTKIKTELGYESSVDLQTGLKRTLQWFRSQKSGY